MGSQLSTPLLTGSSPRAWGRGSWFPLAGAELRALPQPLDFIPTLPWGCAGPAGGQHRGLSCSHSPTASLELFLAQHQLKTSGAQQPKPSIHRGGTVPGRDLAVVGPQSSSVSC